jgi:negative regulator of sigma-B (phosphoserine phosphatase)
MTDRPQTSLIEWAVAGVPLEAGTESGDLHVVAPFDDGVLVGAIDGLGHGPEAAEAARAAALVLEAHADEPLLRLFERCHEALRKTRGAVITLASFHGCSGEMTWMGVGNVEGMLLRADRAKAIEAAPLRGGIVGLRLPAPRDSSVFVVPGDMLILATDGIRGGFTSGLDRSACAASLAETILSDHRKSSDDATVVVARYLGLAP